MMSQNIKINSASGPQVTPGNPPERMVSNPSAGAENLQAPNSSMTNTTNQNYTDLNMMKDKTIENNHRPGDMGLNFLYDFNKQDHSEMSSESKEEAQCCEKTKTENMKTHKEKKDEVYKRSLRFLKKMEKVPQELWTKRDKKLIRKHQFHLRKYECNREHIKTISISESHANETIASLTNTPCKEETQFQDRADNRLDIEITSSKSKDPVPGRNDGSSTKLKLMKTEEQRREAGYKRSLRFLRKMEQMPPELMTTRNKQLIRKHKFHVRKYESRHNSANVEDQAPTENTIGTEKATKSCDKEEKEPLTNPSTSTQAGTMEKREIYQLPDIDRPLLYKSTIDVSIKTDEEKKADGYQRSLRFLRKMKRLPPESLTNRDQRLMRKHLFHIRKYESLRKCILSPYGRITDSPKP